MTVENNKLRIIKQDFKKPIEAGRGFLSLL
jgi:hypothetical protein